MYNLTNLPTCRVCRTQFHVEIRSTGTVCQPIERCPLLHFPIVILSLGRTRVIWVLPNLKEEWRIRGQKEDWQMWHKLISSNCGKNYPPPLIPSPDEWIQNTIEALTSSFNWYKKKLADPHVKARRTCRPFQVFTSFVWRVKSLKLLSLASLCG